MPFQFETTPTPPSISHNDSEYSCCSENKGLDKVWNIQTLKIDGVVSNPFSLERGTRQGCPISPLLFAIFIEPLSQSIIENKNIKGICMKGGE